VSHKQADSSRSQNDTHTTHARKTSRGTNGFIQQEGGKFERKTTTVRRLEPRGFSTIPHAYRSLRRPQRAVGYNSDCIMRKR
jgi:hypothetical protein